MSTADYDARNALANIKSETTKVTQIESPVLVVSLNLRKIIFVLR